MEKSIKLVPVYSTRNYPLYQGKLSNYQQIGNTLNKKKVMNYSEGQFNSYQNFLYNRAMYGLAVFTKEELAVMHSEKKKRIIKVHLRTKKVLNIWKQELSNIIFNKFFQPKFVNTKAEFAKDFVELYANEVDETIECTTSFKTLGITKKYIVNKLIKEKILPYNFLELLPVNHGLIKLKTS